ncbi:hypothetical protein LguiB_006639 [Lonicera macranthoides]
MAGNEYEFLRKHHKHEVLSGHRFTPLLSAKAQMAGNEYEFLRKHHKHEVGENQCSSHLVKRIKAPIDLGDVKVGSVREVKLQSGFPASTSTERLEILDDEEHVIGVRTVAGDHRLKKYTSTVTVHSEMVDGQPGTLVVESFVVDVPDGNTKDETCYCAEALIECNLQSLADVSESLAAKDPMGFTGGSNPGSHELESKSTAGIVEDKLKSTRQDGQNTVPMEVESEAEFSNQEASSLTVEWTSPEVSLTNGRCSELPEKPNCPFLVKLFLQHNAYLTKIPVSFFENMPVLRVLDISHTSIKTLPLSICKVFRLRELYLRGCKMLMQLPPEIGHLTNLKVLDLEGTELVSLPKQIGWLLQLEGLKFSLYRFADRHLESINGIERSIIPRETLSKLTSLKELSIDVDPECEWWDAEVEAIISDLGKLGNLEMLKLYFPTVELFQQLQQRRCVKRLEWDIAMPMIYPTLSNFRFIVGRHEDHIMSSVPRDLQYEFVKLEKCFRYVNGVRDSDAITKALEHVGALFLDRHWTIEWLSVSDMERMNKLKFCLIAECNEMRAILGRPTYFRELVKDSGREPILTSLCYLGIHYMKNLHKICGGKIANGSLSNLKFLAIHTCPVLSSIFNFSLLDNLIFLQELIVEDCPKVRSLVTQESSRFQHKEFLPRLEKISLLHLPELNNISTGVWIAPRLQKMVIYNCLKLKNLHPLERCSRDVKEIKGESEWWESNKLDWSSDHHEYLIHVFVPLQEDDDSIDELAEAVQISLIMSQATESIEDLILNMDMKKEDKLEVRPKEIGTSKSVSDELEQLPMELVSSNFSTNKLKISSWKKFYWGLLAEPRKNPEFSFPSVARTLGQLSLAGCNLSDSSIPWDLSGLCSLWELDLSFTPISRLPEGIKWPNAVRFLKLNGCRNLHYLPELPLLQVLAVNECTALERINFVSNKTSSAPVSMLSHGCDKLVEVDSVFRLEPIGTFDAEVMNSWGLDNLKSMGNIEVELCNNMTRTRKKLPPQGLFEFGILSTFLPMSKIPSFFGNMQSGSSMTFVVPSSSPNLNLLRGMNICIVYVRSKEYKYEQYYDFHINVSNSNRVLNWTYYPTVCLDGEDDMMWLSHWDMRDYQLEAGDIVNVSVDVGAGFEVRECGTCLVYGESKEIVTPLSTS